MFCKSTYKQKDTHSFIAGEEGKRCSHISLFCAVLSQLSCVQLFVTTWTAACQAPLSIGILKAKTLEWVAMPSSRGSSQSRSLALQADSLPSETPGKPKNTGVGSLSFLQGVFPTQESNWGLLHCRLIFCQLSYQGSPPYGKS